MNAMAKVKQKVVKTKRVAHKARAVTTPTQAKRGMQSDMWRTQLSNLQTQEFQSAESALKAVCQGVLDQLGVTGQERSEQEKFMQDLLCTDPELKGKLLQALKVRKR